ncbi:putative type II secretion system protein [Arthrobacter globiformis NBRC 12137]|uniref:Putative type II secretion system protein n=1 Tax=Arthrobacter globiformis (strain ATCC 8010 / DSM 20124 / JCM 1332 / NBRC 12137 / NCIMB 8907 / NRRL B-2979 / 168) TaxID=1077972 RepID=H0QPT3_ARTG1|nr:type II secretion system F family protein [Arthrobacter globiformis]GAB14834.1 putative type II secretion system protein [Arthrobacter globiformis NBRC 12137]
MIVTLGVVLVIASVVLGGVAVLIPRTPTVPLDRRRPFRTEADSQLTRFAGSAVQSVDRVLAKRNLRYFNRETLENAGLRLSQAEFILLILVGAFVGALIGLVVAGPLLAILMVIAAPFVGHLVLGFLAGKRRGKFDEQLGDTLQLLSGSLRAGHSILRAIDAAANESQAPTSEEMRRIVSETSLGRDLLVSLNDTADRMKSEDFVWISQAIQINREVGGNLAEVLDQVNETIRERSEIKGHIKALAAEGKFSAYILMALPVGIVVMLSLVNPGYMNKMFTNPLGWIMIVASIILMTVGGLWMRKIINLKF